MLRTLEHFSSKIKLHVVYFIKNVFFGSFSRFLFNFFFLLQKFKHIKSSSFFFLQKNNSRSDHLILYVLTERRKHTNWKCLWAAVHIKIFLFLCSLVLCLTNTLARMKKISSFSQSQTIFKEGPLLMLYYFFLHTQQYTRTCEKEISGTHIKRQIHKQKKNLKLQ